MGFGRVVDDVGQQGMGVLSPCFVHGPEGSLDVHGVGQNVGGSERFHAAKRQHRSHARRAHARDGLLRSHDDRGRGEDGILAQVRKGSMPAFALDGQVNLVGRRHVGPAPNADMACWELGVHVLGQDVVGGGVGQNARGHHAFGAPGNELLSRLKNAAHGAGPVVFGGLQQLNGPKQGGGVHVVSTRVHHPGVGRGVGHVVGLLNGQGIHVGAKGHHTRLRVDTAHMGHDAGVGHVRFMVDSPRLQLIGHERHGLVLLKGQFGMGVQVAPQRHPLPVVFVHERLDAFQKGHDSKGGLRWLHAVQSMRQEAYNITRPNTNLTHASDNFKLHLDPAQAPATNVTQSTAA